MNLSDRASASSGLPELSIKRPIFISMIFLAIALFGVIAFRFLPVELMPNMSFGHITIYINVRGGIAASEIEKKIAKPVEEAVGSVNHLQDILAISKEGSCRIILKFEPGTDMDFAALEVREKFSRVRNKLPPEIEKPIIAKYEYTDVPMAIIAITSDFYSPEDLRKLVDDKVRDRIQRIEGVAKVEVTGGRESKVLIEVDQYKLQSFSLPISTVVDVIGANNTNLLVGELEQGPNKTLLRTIGEVNNLEDLENIVITTTEKGSTIRIKDIAKVEDSYLDPRGFSRINAEPSVALYIQKESLANTVKVSKLIKEEVLKLKDELGDKFQINIASNQAEQVQESIKGVKKSLLLGAILAFVVLILFFRRFASFIAIGIAIPISLLFTFSLMYITKLTVNLMTLSGLALGVGMLVDNTIVVIDNILKKNDIVKGTNEVVLAITASTLTTLAVFVPIVFINPEIRILYSGLALTMSFALCSSLFCAISLVPMIMSKLGTCTKNCHPGLASRRSRGLDPGSSEPARFPGSRLGGRDDKFGYRRVLEFALRFRYFIILAVALIFAGSLFLANSLEKEFIGIASQNKFTIFVELPTGTRLDITNGLVEKLENHLNEFSAIRTVTSKIEPWSGRVFVELKSSAQRNLSTSEVIAQIRPFTEKLEPAFIYFEESKELGTKQILLEVFGYDYEVLKSIAMQMGQNLKGVKEFTDTKIRMREGRPELLVKIDKAKAAMLGLTVKEVSLTLHTQLRGLVSTRYRGQIEPVIKLDAGAGTLSLSDKAKNIETIVRLREEFRKTINDLKKIHLTNKSGEIIYLSQVADFEFSVGPSEVWRKNKARMVQVSTNTGGVALGTAAEKIKIALKKLKLPKDYFWQFGETYYKMIKNQKELIFALILSILMVYMILAGLFESFIQPLVILITVPLSTIGAILALKLTNNPISVGVLMGLILLGGIVVNNAIILIDKINKTSSQSNKERIIEAAGDRLRPIMMTSLTTIASMLFMAMDKSESSNLWSPLAITVIGGMSVATLLTLFVVPALYLIFEDFR